MKYILTMETDSDFDFKFRGAHFNYESFVISIITEHDNLPDKKKLISLVNEFEFFGVCPHHKNNAKSMESLRKRFIKEIQSWKKSEMERYMNISCMGNFGFRLEEVREEYDLTCFM